MNVLLFTLQLSVPILMVYCIIQMLHYYDARIKGTFDYLQTRLLDGDKDKTTITK